MDENRDVLPESGYSQGVYAETPSPSPSPFEPAAATAQENLALGIVGAVLGVLGGVIIWVIIGRLGFIAAIAGAAMAYGALFGYSWLAKGMSKRGAIVCIVVVVLAVFFSVKLDWALSIYDVLKEEGFAFSECFFGQGKILAAVDSTGRFILDLLLGYALAAAGAFSAIRKAL